MTGDGIAEVWRKVNDYRSSMIASNEFEERRSNQAKAWMWSEIEENLIAALRDHPKGGAQVENLESKVASGDMAPGAAAREMLSVFLGT